MRHGARAHARVISNFSLVRHASPVHSFTPPFTWCNPCVQRTPSLRPSPGATRASSAPLHSARRL
eukprot:4005267-Prymnesium_polylepis.1